MSTLTAAVPDYLGQDFDKAAPGHRFYLYLQFWQRTNAGGLDTTTEKAAALKRALKLGDNDKAAMAALAERQNRIAGNNIWRLPGKSVAPLTTGLGMEHPLENGFAFLNPYGLPYLPGSGIKGVLRQAARELHEDGEPGWAGDEGEQAIETLFGTASDDAGQRGALIFWDAFPVLPRTVESLAPDVMTPHQTHYYRDGEPPHDSGQPTPIYFVTIPPGAQFEFYVDCKTALLNDDLADNNHWQALLREAFEYAFEWLGFGAKTAVGYGEMEMDTEKQAEQQEQAEAEKTQAEEKRRVKQATANLPEDAAELAEKQARGLWPSGDNNQIVPDLIAFFSTERESISQEAHDLIAEEMEARWPGITKDPEAIRVTRPATKKKPAKTKPRFLGKSKELAIRLLAIEIKDSQ